MRSITSFGAAAGFAAFVITASAGAGIAAGSASAPPSTMFKSGFNKCKLVTLAALTVGCGVFLAATWRHGKAEPANDHQN